MDDLTTEDRIASKNEINVLKMLHHPNIIGYYDSFTAEKSLMIVMEYAPGEKQKKIMGKDLNRTSIELH